MGILRAVSGCAAAVTLAAVIAAMSCQGAVETTPSEEPEPPLSRCSVYTNKEDCCTADCGWMKPNGEFPGRCFDEHEDCMSATPCVAPERCYFVNGNRGQCQLALNSINEEGVCVTTCPAGTVVRERNEQEVCSVPPPNSPDAGTDGGE